MYGRTHGNHFVRVNTLVRLFAEPDEGSTPKHIVIQPLSKIEYLESRVAMAWHDTDPSIFFNPTGDAWLKIRIDGQEGWIHTEEDFEAVGLPAVD